MTTRTGVPVCRHCSHPLQLDHSDQPGATCPDCGKHTLRLASGAWPHVEKVRPSGNGRHPAAEEPTQPAQSYIPLRALRGLSLTELLDQDDGEDPPDLVERLVPQAGAALLAGRPGEGKTWLLLALVLSVAGGLSFLGRFRCEPGPVMVIDEENGVRRLRKRLRRLCAAMALDPAELAPIVIYSMQGLDLGARDWAEPIAEQMRLVQPVLVVADSLVRVHRGDENSSRDMSSLFASVTALRTEFNTAFMFSHHLRKRGLINDLAERVRGSSDIEAYMDTVLGLEKIDDRLVLRQTKDRDGGHMKPLALAIQDLTDDATNVVVVGEVDEQAEKREQARDLVRELVADGPKLREGLMAAAKEAKLSERTMTDALRDLVDTGEVVRAKDGRRTTYGAVGHAE